MPGRKATGSPRVVCEQLLVTSGLRDEPIGWYLRGGATLAGGGGGDVRTAWQGRAGPDWADQSASGTASTRAGGIRSPSPNTSRRHALAPRAAQERVPGRGAQVHRALQQVLPVPAVHEAVSGLRYGVGGRLQGPWGAWRCRIRERRRDEALGGWEDLLEGVQAGKG